MCSCFWQRGFESIQFQSSDEVVLSCAIASCAVITNAPEDHASKKPFERAYFAVLVPAGSRSATVD